MQNTWPRIVSSHFCQMGRVVSRDFMERNISSTIQSCLYVSATSLVGRVVFVRSTHMPQVPAVPLVADEASLRSTNSLRRGRRIGPERGFRNFVPPKSTGSSYPSIACSGLR